MNLHGLRVLNTRPEGQGLPLSKAIKKAGGVAINYPALMIEPTATDWLKKLPDLAAIDKTIFISSNAIHYFFKTLRQQQLIWPLSIKNIVIGKASAATLAQWQIQMHEMPLIADSKHLLQLDSLQQVNRQTILLVKGKEGKKDIADSLTARGANLIPIDVYQRILPSIKPQFTHSLWHDNGVDIILFTSQQAIQNVFALFGKEAHTWLCNKPCIVISERLREAASQVGMQTIIVSQYDELLATLEHYAITKEIS